jgi:hypothetical protein
VLETSQSAGLGSGRLVVGRTGGYRLASSASAFSAFFLAALAGLLPTLLAALLTALLAALLAGLLTALLAALLTTPLAALLVFVAWVLAHDCYSVFGAGRHSPASGERSPHPHVPRGRQPPWTAVLPEKKGLNRFCAHVRSRRDGLGGVGSAASAGFDSGSLELSANAMRVLRINGS